MKPQQIVGEGQNVVAQNGVNTILQNILVEFNMTFQQIVAELRLTHVAQQELARSVAPKTTQTQPERAARSSVTLEITAAKPALRPFAQRNR